MSRCFNKNVLKTIASEWEKKQCLHYDILMEMHLTQNILKETDTKYLKNPGYIQHFSVDPFGVHMFTETRINILVQQNEKKNPVPLTTQWKNVFSISLFILYSLYWVLYVKTFIY